MRNRSTAARLTSRSSYSLLYAAFARTGPTLGITALILSVAIGTAHAQLNQIGSSANVQGQPAYTSQNFGAPNTRDNIAVIDDFTVTGAENVTDVEGAFLGFAGFTAGDYADVTDWDVEFYTTATAAASNLTGNVASVVVGPSGVTLTKPYGTDNLSALVDVPVSVLLPSAGTYWVAIIPVLNYESTGGAEIGVYGSTFAGTPSNDNAIQVNPGGGFGFSGNQNELGINAAYNVTGTLVATPTPEPGIVVTGLVMLGTTGLGIMRGRRRAKRSTSDIA